MKKLVLVVGLLLVGAAAVICFLHITRVHVLADCVADITLVKDKVVEQIPIYPTKLLSVDPNQMGAEISVQFPERGWVNFHGRKNEMVKDLGYYITEIEPDQIQIQVWFSANEWKWVWQ